MTPDNHRSRPDQIASESRVGPLPDGSQVAVPPGWIAFDRYDAAFGAEGPYMGTLIIRPDGTDERSFSVPLTSFGLGAAWSRDGEQFVVNTWTEADQGSRPGVVDVDGSDFAKLVPDGVDGDFGFLFGLEPRRKHAALRDERDRP